MTQATPLRAAVVGATGYIGMQCTALLAAHPDVELSRVLGHSSAGKRHCDVVPGSTVELTIEDGLDPGGDHLLEVVVEVAVGRLDLREGAVADHRAEDLVDPGEPAGP